MTQVPTDYTGREIKVGDDIAYATLLGRSAALSRGKVVEILEGNKNHREGFGLKVQRLNADGTVKMTSKWGYVNGDYQKLGDVPSGVSTLSFPSRVVVINNQVL